MTAVWAHRGASADSPENSLAAFAGAVVQGADAVELDVHLSADKVVVVIHDQTVDKTTSGSGRVDEFTAQQLAELGVPSLAEVFALLDPHGIEVNVELKGGVGLEEAVAAVVAEKGMADRVWISAFDPARLGRMRDSGLRLALLCEDLADPLAQARELGAAALHPPFAETSASLVAAAHAAGMRVHPWTLNDPAQWSAAVELGVDAVITDRPGAMRQALDGA